MCQSELTEFFAELTEFAPKPSEAQWVLFSEFKQYSRNSIPPVSNKNSPELGFSPDFQFWLFFPIVIPGPISGPVWFPILGRRPETYFLAGRLLHTALCRKNLWIFPPHVHVNLAVDFAVNSVMDFSWSFEPAKTGNNGPEKFAPKFAQEFAPKFAPPRGKIRTGLALQDAGANVWIATLVGRGLRDSNRAARDFTRAQQRSGEGLVRGKRSSIGRSRMYGRRTSGTSRPSLGAKVRSPLFLHFLGKSVVQQIL